VLVLYQKKMNEIEQAKKNKSYLTELSASTSSANIAFSASLPLPLSLTRELFLYKKKKE
jgi:hypothetical protein